MNRYTLPAGQALVLRTSNPAGHGHGGFQWPARGPIAAPDWNPDADHGGGLWGLLWGHGDPRHLIHARTRGAVWQVVEVPAESILFKHGKVKYPAGTVVLASRSRRLVTAFLNRHNPEAVPRLTMPPRDVGPGKAYSVLVAALVVLVGVHSGALSFTSCLFLAGLEALLCAFLTVYEGQPRAGVPGPVTWLPDPAAVADEAEAWLADQTGQTGQLDRKNGEMGNA